MPSHTQASIKHLAKNSYYFNVYNVNKLVAFNNNEQKYQTKLNVDNLPLAGK